MEEVNGDTDLLCDEMRETRREIREVFRAAAAARTDRSFSPLILNQVQLYSSTRLLCTYCSTFLIKLQGPVRVATCQGSCQLEG